MMSGFWTARSDAQALDVVMLDAKDDIKGEETDMLAAQVASRVWEIRTGDLEAWKKELEFCLVLVVDQLIRWGGGGGNECTWSSRENGRHDLKVAFVSMSSIND